MCLCLYLHTLHILIENAINWKNANSIISFIINTAMAGNVETLFDLEDRSEGHMLAARSFYTFLTSVEL